MSAIMSWLASNSGALLGFRPGSAPLQNIPAPPHKYDPVRMGPGECIERIKKVAEAVKQEIPSENVNLDKVICLITRSVPEEPVVTNCGHVFEEVALDQFQSSTPHAKCPTCSTPITTVSPDYALRNMIKEWQKEDRIPTLAHFKESNQKLAALYLEVANSSINEKEILDAYAKAFLYTKRVEDYAAVPLLYEQLNQPEKATLAHLHLALYQLEEGKVAEAVETLRRAKQKDPKLKIDAIIVSLDLEKNPSQELIESALFIASQQKDPQEAISIYKQVLAVSPRQLEAYVALCPLLKDPAERNHLFSKAAEYALQAGNAELAKRFRKAVYPTSLSKIDWANPAEFLKKLPPMPKELVDFLEDPCPIYGHEGKKARETHIVVPLMKNITTVVDGVSVVIPRTLRTLNELEKDAEGCGGFDIINFPHGVNEPSEVEFEWGVMTKDVLPGSGNKNYSAQKQLAEAKGYQMPSLLDAVTCILWAKRHLGIILYRSSTAVRCHEMAGRRGLVGLFGARGSYYTLCLSGTLNGYANDRAANIGVAGMRKFSV